MKPIIKNILIKGLTTYNQSSLDEKVVLKNKVISNLEIHNNAMKNIGMGSAGDFVIAGQIFLRYISIYKVN